MIPSNIFKFVFASFAYLLIKLSGVVGFTYIYLFVEIYHSKFKTLNPAVCFTGKIGFIIWVIFFWGGGGGGGKKSVGRVGFLFLGFNVLNFLRCNSTKYLTLTYVLEHFWKTVNICFLIN